MAIVIDALDECDDKDLIADFFEIIAHTFRIHQLPLRFLFTSRIEEHIRKRFATSPAVDMTYPLDLQNFSANRHCMFFRSWFSAIFEENRQLMRHIPQPWPSESDLDEIVRESSGSFIFASTFVNFVNDGSDLPHRKLRAGFAGLDPLYTQVLTTAARSPHFARVFGTIMLATQYLSVVTLADLLQLETGDVIHALLGIQSILLIPQDDKQPIRPFHTSMRDFLYIQARSNNLFINHPARHLSITTDCIALMKVQAAYNLLPGGGLEYAVESWCHHLACVVEEEGGVNLLNSQHSISMMRELIGFVSHSFDLWLDCIILQVTIMIILDKLDSLLKKLNHGPTSLLNIIQKIRNFAQEDEVSNA